MLVSGKVSKKQGCMEQCFACENTIPRKKYKNKSIYYNNTKVKLCPKCSTGDNKLRDKNNIEFLECTICNKEVTHDISIFCNTCSTWIHAECSSLTMREFNALSESENDNWCCQPCEKQNYPLLFTGESIFSLSKGWGCPQESLDAEYHLKL